MFKLVLPVLALLAALPAWAKDRALDLLDPSVSYTADFSFQDDKGRYNGTVWHAPGRERREFDTKGGQQAVLIRKDMDAVYLIKLPARWHLGISLQAAGAMAGGLDGLVIERIPMGEEMVAGQKTIRNKMVGRAADGSRFDGEGWFTKDGILMRATGVMTAASGKSHSVETQLSSLKIGRVEPSRFEPPSGGLAFDLRKIPPDRMRQALEGLKPMLDGR